MRRQPFEFNCIPVGTDNGYLQRGGTTIPINASVPEQVKDFMHEPDCAWAESGEPGVPPGVTPWGRMLVGLGQVLYKPRIYPCPVDCAIPSTTSSLMRLGFGIPGQVIHTPGHSPGSISVLLDSGEVFAGDMAMNTWFLRSTPGLPVLAEDMNLVVKSWRRLIRMGAKQVYPAHGANFPIEIIQKEIKAWEQTHGSKS